MDGWIGAVWFALGSVLMRPTAHIQQQDATELVAGLRAAHHKAQAEGEAELMYQGLDLYKGLVRNNLEAGVVEPAISKIKSLRFATEAAITILRIDDLIKVNERRPDGQ